MKKIIFIFTMLIFSCSQNILQDMSSIDPDQKYYDLAMESLNAEKFDEAISIVNTQITTNGQTQSKVRELLASAYAGKCGLNFVDYTQKLSQQSSGSAFSILMKPFIQVAVDPASCRLALQTMDLIGDTSVRTPNQNLFTSITGMVLLGSALRSYADTTPSSLGDGVVDVNLCTGLTDPQMDDIIIGFGYFNKNFSAVGESMIGSGSSSALIGISSICTNALGASACDITDPTDITPLLRDSFRDLVNTSEYGIGPYVTGGNALMIPMSCP